MAGNEGKAAGCNRLKGTVHCTPSTWLVPCRKPSANIRARPGAANPARRISLRWLPCRARARWLSTAVLLLGSIAVAGASCGCAIKIPWQSGPTSHYLILGCGIVSVNDATPDASTVTKVDAVGVVITDEPNLKFSLGYATSRTVSVAQGAEDVRIEVNHRPGGDIVVVANSAKVRKEAP